MHLYALTLLVEDSALCAFESEDSVSDIAACTDPAKIESKLNHDDPIK